MDLAKVLFNEKGSSHFRAANLLSMLNLANRLAYRAIAQNDPSHFAEYSRVTYPASAESIDLSGASYLNSVPFKVSGVAELKSDEAVSDTNRPVPLEQSNSGNLQVSHDYPLIGQTLHTWQIDQGVQLRLQPVPSKATVLYIRWVPHQRTLTANDALLTSSEDSANSVRATEWHDQVVSLLMMLMEGTERGTRPDMASLSAWMTEQLEQSNVGRTEHHYMEYDDPY